MAAYPILLGGKATDGETEGGNSETFSYVVGKVSFAFVSPSLLCIEEGRPVLESRPRHYGAGLNRQKEECRQGGSLPETHELRTPFSMRTKPHSLSFPPRGTLLIVSKGTIRFALSLT